MKKTIRFLNVIFLKGLYIIVPLMLILLFFKASIDFIKNITNPIVNLLPEEALFGLGLSYTVSIIFLLLIIMLAGYLQEKEIGISIFGKVENLLPGFSVVKKIFKADTETGIESTIKPCLVSVDDAWVFGFIIEENNDGISAVFVPDSPKPTSGSVYFMDVSKIREIDVKPKEVFRCLTQLGAGSGKILEGKVEW